MPPLFRTDEEFAAAKKFESEEEERLDRIAREEYELEQKRKEEEAAREPFCGEQRTSPDFWCDAYGWDQPEDRLPKQTPRRKYTDR